MKTRHILLIFTLICTGARAQKFEYFKSYDVFKYFEDDHPGLTLFPMGNSGHTSKAADAERLLIRKRILSNDIDTEGIMRSINDVLDDKNYLGFFHLNLAISKSGKEVEIVKNYKQLLSQDAQKNFVVLYGACIAFLQLNERPKIDPIDTLIEAIEKRNLNVSSTKRYPNLIKHIKDKKRDK